MKNLTYIFPIMPFALLSLTAALSDGYWVVFRHLQKGAHNLKIHAEILQSGIVVEGSYIINVL